MPPTARFIRRSIPALLMGLACAAAAAQANSSAEIARSSDTWDFSGGASFLRAGGASYYGWQTALTERPYDRRPWLGGTIDVSGNYNYKTESNLGVSVTGDTSVFTFAAGPSFSATHGRLRPSVHVLLGGFLNREAAVLSTFQTSTTQTSATQTNTTQTSTTQTSTSRPSSSRTGSAPSTSFPTNPFPTTTTQTGAGTSGNQTAFAVFPGGGVDFALTRHAAVRVQADYIRTLTQTGGQNAVKGAAGLVYSF